MSNSVRSHRWQPTRLPRPWDSPGKNTGVGCQFLLQCMKVKSESEVAQSCPALRDPMDHSPPDSSIHGIFQARVLECGAIVFSRPNPSEAENLIPDNSNWTKGQNVTSSSLEPIPEHICGKQGLGKHPAGVASVQFSCLVVSNSLRPHELQHARPPCPSPTPRVHSNSRPSRQ